MNRNKLVTFLKNGLIACFLIIGISASAQHKTSEERAKKLTDTMSVKLSLSQDQYQKVYDINLDFIKKAAETKNDGGDKMARMKQMKSLSSDRDAALKPVLSEDQYSEFKEFKKENRKEMKGKMKRTKD